MRLIDADELEKTLRDWIRNHWTDAFTGDDAGSEFADMIGREETIDTAKVVRAHWEKVYSNRFTDMVKCSHCGQWYNRKGVCYSHHDANYCPNCGAAMQREPN